MLFYFNMGTDFYFVKAIKRSIFVQIFTFSLNGLRTMLKDKRMEMMMFATGNIYRKTGTLHRILMMRNTMQLEGEEGKIDDLDLYFQTINNLLPMFKVENLR